MAGSQRKSFKGTIKSSNIFNNTRINYNQDNIKC